MLIYDVRFIIQHVVVGAYHAPARSGVVILAGSILHMLRSFRILEIKMGGITAALGNTSFAI